MHWLHLWEWITNVLNGNNPVLPGNVVLYLSGLGVVIWRVERRDRKAGKTFRQELSDAEREIFHPGESAENTIANKGNTE